MTNLKPVLKKAAMGTFLIVIFAMININLVTPNFVISVAIIFLPIFGFLSKGFPLFTTALFSSIGVVILRILLYLYEYQTVSGVLANCVPEMAFYIVYGLLLRLYFVKHANYSNRYRNFIPLVIIDIASNTAELFIRLDFNAFMPHVLLGLFIVAILRSLLSLVVLASLEHYGILVIKRDDAIRYRQLLIMSSNLNSEIFWLKKSAALIERTVSDAFSLYNELEKIPEAKAYGKTAMGIAKDIHEVKKEYILITRGIEKALLNTNLNVGMEFKDICNILDKSLISGSDKNIKLFIEYDHNFYTTKHYYLMSVLHNLISNSIDAAGDEAGNIWLRETSDGEFFILTVADDCGGVDEDYIDRIFTPGFSNKINEDTGEINRGLGLPIVKEIVEENFSGKLEMESADGHTKFTLKLPIKILEG
ncbi:ATP-binding protein [Anaeropeptidivorans aminofermentans]|uniref:ATP-binding protein n=1 Tax=Anaeropeptidivorans aminofermentans TaxID=2934315 RepID=UPI002024A172|nr:sensor histidine kinase [Anaeropeptidivorans aminofermentans]MBE6012015.1 sensor histidine kinase [Lachnospiraceae bacterium]